MSPAADPPDPAHDALAAFWRGERVAVLATLVRDARDDIDAAEDALAEAATRAAVRWSVDGVPERPAAWLLTTARRVLVDVARAAGTRASRDAMTAHDEPVALHETTSPHGDDRLALVYTCCHPALSRPAQVTLALRMLGGLSVREIARALLEPEATTAQRLVRTKRKIRDARIPFRVPAPHELSARTPAVHESLYLLFNEGYGATYGDLYLRDAIADEAIRLARLVVAATPGDAASLAESLGLLALMLLHHARRDARVDDEGVIVPLEAQDRARWDRRMIREGEHLLDRAMALMRSGPYQLQAAIAALHATAPTASDTDWRQIALLYGALRFQLPTPVVELNAAVALAMVHGPDWGLAQLDALVAERGMRDYHLLPAARADLLRRAGRHADATVAYREAIALARSPAEQRYLARRLDEVAGTPNGPQPVRDGSAPISE